MPAAAAVLPWLVNRRPLITKADRLRRLPAHPRISHANDLESGLSVGTTADTASTAAYGQTQITIAPAGAATFTYDTLGAVSGLGLRAQSFGGGSDRLLAFFDMGAGGIQDSGFRGCFTVNSLTTSMELLVPVNTSFATLFWLNINGLKQIEIRDNSNTVVATSAALTDGVIYQVQAAWAKGTTSTTGFYMAEVCEYLTGVRVLRFAGTNAGILPIRRWQLFNNSLSRNGDITWDFLSASGSLTPPPMLAPVVAPATPITIDAGLTEEIESVFGSVIIKNAAAGLAGETEALLPGAWNKRISLSAVGETEALFGAAVSKRIATGLVGETEQIIATAWLAPIIISAGQVIETESVLAEAWQKRLPAGVVAEAEAVLASARRKQLLVGAVGETEAVLGSARRKMVGLGFAGETESVLPASRVKRVSPGVIGETEAILLAGKMKRASAGLIGETESVFASTRRKMISVGRAEEFELIITPGFSGVVMINAGLLVETEAIRASAMVKRPALGGVTEAETIILPTWRKRVGLGAVAETELLISPAWSKRVGVGLGGEAESLLLGSWAKLVSAGLVEEIETIFEILQGVPVDLWLIASVMDPRFEAEVVDDRFIAGVLAERFGVAVVDERLSAGVSESRFESEVRQ